MTQPTKEFLELLAPAKNFELGKIAIAHGADAVYIGPSDFGARAAVGNSLSEIAALVEYAHGYNARVFATLNTLLFDQQVDPAFDLAWQLYEIGVDALIIQDMALCDLQRLPPIELHASTQTHNYTLERIQFLESVGFDRVILARECSHAQITEMRAGTSLPFEAFVHGALCVSFSGQCFLSEALCGRSANKGVCAQACRYAYRLVNAQGKVLLKNKHLLSLKDHCQYAHLPALIEAGVRSFKIEGRLKDADYVKNVVSAYRQALDAYIGKHPEYASASGARVTHSFAPRLSASFNRGYTDYFAQKRRPGLISPLSPKSIGEYVGIIQKIGPSRKLQTDLAGGEDICLSNGDGLVFFSEDQCPGGSRLNAVHPAADGSGFVLEINDDLPLVPGMRIYRNYHHQFQKTLLSDTTAERKIPLSLCVKQTQEGDLLLIATDDREHTVQLQIPASERGELARNPQLARARFEQAFSKLGGTPYVWERMALPEGHPSLPEGPTSLQEDPMRMPPPAVLNGWRRALVDRLNVERRAEYSRKKQLREAELQQKRAAWRPPSKRNYAFLQGDFRDNVTNASSAAFYRRLTHQRVEPIPSVGKSPGEIPVMTCKYCLKYELGRCTRISERDSDTISRPLEVKKSDWTDRMYLHTHAHIFRLSFDCKACEMQVFLEK